MTIATQRSIQNEVRVGRADRDVGENVAVEVDREVRRADRDVGDHVAVEVDHEVRRAKLEGAWWTLNYSSE